MAIDVDARRMHFGAATPPPFHDGSGGGGDLDGSMPLAFVLPGAAAAAGALTPAVTHHRAARSEYIVNLGAGAGGAASFHYPPPPGYEPVAVWLARRAATPRHLPVEALGAGSGAPAPDPLECLEVEPLAGARHLLVSGPHAALELAGDGRSSAMIRATTAAAVQSGMSAVVLTALLGRVSVGIRCRETPASSSSSSSSTAAARSIMLTLEPAGEWAAGVASASCAPDWSAELGIADAGAGGATVAMLSLSSGRAYGGGAAAPEVAGTGFDALGWGARAADAAPAAGALQGGVGRSDAATFLAFTAAAGGRPVAAAALRELPAGVYLVIRLGEEEGGATCIASAAVDGELIPLHSGGPRHWVYPLLPPLRQRPVPLSIQVALQRSGEEGSTSLSIALELGHRGSPTFVHRTVRLGAATAPATGSAFADDGGLGAWHPAVSWSGGAVVAAARS